MPWGRFAGTPFDRLPIWYLRWLLDQNWLQTPLRAALLAECDRRFPEPDGR